MPQRRTPFLELWTPDGGPASRFAVQRLPFRIGRSSDVELQLDSQQVSKAHAEIVLVDDVYRIQDLGSRNGTFLNGRRVDGPLDLNHGDVVHLAGHDLRFLVPTGQPRSHLRTRAATLTADDPSAQMMGVPQFLEALEGRGVETVFQPLVAVHSRQRVGFEALTRTRLTGPPAGPGGLFALAERHHRAGALSRALRRVALAAATGLPRVPSLLFLNVHPAEMDDLPRNLAEVARTVPKPLRVVLEVHESAITEDLTMMRTLRDEIHRHGMGLAFDDVGAGRSRLREIADAPPDYVKLDRSLITDIDRSPARQQLLRGLLKATSELGIRAVAEGVETQQELDVCTQLGCELAQGYFLGPPLPAVDVLLGP